MDDMHAKRRPEGLIAAWLCLIIAGAATVTFNVVNAYRSGMASPLGWIEGVVPVALAMLVSHLVATSSAGRVLRGVTFAVMIGALALSVRATGDVVAPAAGPLWWLYGAVVDIAALGSLQVLLTIKAKAAREAAQRAAADAAAVDERAALRAQLEAAQTAQAAAQDRADDAQRAAAQAAETAAQATRKLDAAKAKTARSRTAQTRAPAPRSDRATAPATEVPDDISARAEALSILAAEPDISGAQLGVRVGMSKRWGQTFKNELAAAAPKGQDQQEQ